ncbi:MAG: 2-succinyl-5-enolpyruvyl-6-hydroxy-3-cyclohexene-1-carboxylic-acid synthase [Planctomycetota bacterium]
MRDAPNINLAFTMLAAEECWRLGVRHAVVSPGSRSAPLAVAFARHAGIRVHVAHDERGGAFMALGIAKSSGVPAVAVMTSGTAVANALPAIVEARMTRTPMLVFAADRPPELRDCGANQAIPQANLLAGAARWTTDMPCPSTEIAAEFVLSTVDEAFARACGDAGAQGGAVHVNWQFREPLAPDARPWDIGWLWSIARWTQDTRRAPWRAVLAPGTCEVEIDGAVVVAGRSSARTAASLARWKGTLLADAASGLARAGTAGADLVLRAALEGDGNAALREALRADAVAVTGDAPVSKRLNAWIAAQRGVTVFGAGDPRVDPSHRAEAVYAGPVTFAPARRLKPHAGWTRALSVATRAAAKALDAERALCEPTAMADAAHACAGRAHGTAFYGSSMPIRDADFMAIAPPKGWHVGANRGASGIDGLIASAVGHAHASGEPVVAFIGDVSALHDLNSLQLAAMVETPLVLVVLNNDGGGIFRYLPIARHDDVFEACFATPHGLSFAAFARGFGLAVEAPRTRAAMGKSVAKALGRGGATVVEVVCAREASEACRARVAQAAVDALAREFRA